MYEGQASYALPLPIDGRVSCEALWSNGCNNNMKSAARVADALRLPVGNDMRVADALHLPKGTAVLRDADALHLLVTLKGTVTQNDVLRTPMNDVMSASPVSCVSSGGKGSDQPVYQKISQQARTSDSDINNCVSSAGTSQCMHGKRFIIRLGGIYNSERDKCMSLCSKNDDKYRAGVPINDKGRKRVKFNPHVEMNMFDENVEPLNFVNSHTDKYVPCNHCEAEDIPASMRI